MSNALIAQLNNPAALLQFNQRMATVVSVLIVVACAHLMVKMTWLFFPQDENTSFAVQKTAPAINKVQSQAQFRQLTSANIFGVTQSTAAQKPSKAPETRLNLTLKGVLAAKPMSLASAIIAKGKSGKEDIYSVGDKMQGGVLIKAIHPDHVVLERNGRLETLKLQKISGVSAQISSSRAESTARSNNSPASALSEIRKNILKNPTSFGEYALPVIVKENGKQIGYRLQPQAKGELLSELGLESSDVITQINGVRLDKPQNGISALRKLSTAKNLTLVVKRNGAEVPLNITLQ